MDKLFNYLRQARADFKDVGLKHSIPFQLAFRKQPEGLGKHKAQSFSCVDLEVFALSLRFAHQHLYFYLLFWNKFYSD
jgi:hypothetical protein